MTGLSRRGLPRKALDFATARSTAFGERHGIGWLIYSPLRMLHYHRMALMDAPAVVAAVLQAFPEASRLADVGCGSGAFAAEFRRRDRSVAACEHALGGRPVARSQGVSVTTFDLDVEPAWLPADLELAYCFEVAKHCTPDQGDRLVAFLAGPAPTVVFSAARPGRGGLGGYINEQEPAYWTERFRRKGASFAESATEDLRSGFHAAGASGSWFVENTLIFTGEVA